MYLSELWMSQNLYDSRQVIKFWQAVANVKANNLVIPIYC